MLSNFTRIKTLVVLTICGLLWQACNIINPTETTPTYIHIDSFQFRANPLLANVTASQQISAVAVYYNNNPVGVFDLPATFPVIAHGTGSLQIAPAVVVDGRNDFTWVYPYYEIDTSTLVAQPGKVINYTPKSQFYNATKITRISDFNGTTNFVQVGGNVGMVYSNTDSTRFEGGVGSIELKAVGDSSIDSSIVALTIPNNKTFIEFNYKSSIPFYVGLKVDLGGYGSAPYFLAGIKPSDHWQKFYLFVSEFASKYGTQNATYYFYVKGVLGDNQTSGKLLLDNIQLVTF